MFNTFLNMPYIPYNIIAYLMKNSQAENFWKLLYYNTPDCLSKPNLTLAQKSALIWSPKQTDNGLVLPDRQGDYSIFLTYLVGNMEIEARTVMKLYQYKNKPVDFTTATVQYAFDILMGQKIAIIDYNGVPCNRAEVIEAELLSCLNGADVSGAGYLQFNGKLDGAHEAQARFDIGNNSTFTGISFLMGIQIIGVQNGQC